MPIPVSCTEKLISTIVRGDLTSRFFFAENVILPSDVNLIAFEMRLMMTCVRRWGSPTTHSTSPRSMSEMRQTLGLISTLFASRAALIVSPYEEEINTYPLGVEREKKRVYQMKHSLLELELLGLYLGVVKQVVDDREKVVSTLLYNLS